MIEETVGSGVTVIPLFASFVLPPGFPRRRLPDRGRPPRAQAGRDDQPPRRPPFPDARAVSDTDPQERAAAGRGDHAGGLSGSVAAVSLRLSSLLWRVRCRRLAFMGLKLEIQRSEKPIRSRRSL
jgi:hypothetical protein